MRSVAILVGMSVIAGASGAQAQQREQMDLSQLLYLFGRQTEEQVKQLREQLDRRERDWHEYVAPLLAAPHDQMGQK